MDRIAMEGTGVMEEEEDIWYGMDCGKGMEQRGEERWLVEGEDQKLVVE